MASIWSAYARVTHHQTEDSYRYKCKRKLTQAKTKFDSYFKTCQTLTVSTKNMQPAFAQGVNGHPPIQADVYMAGGPNSMHAGAPGSMQSSLPPGVHIYGQTTGTNSLQPGQSTGAYGSAPNTMYPNQGNWNNNQMHYQNRYCSRYRWQLFFNQSRHKATIWHRVRFVQPKTYCPECYVPRNIDPDEDDLENGVRRGQGSQDRQCVS